MNEYSAEAQEHLRWENEIVMLGTHDVVTAERFRPTMELVGGNQVWGYLWQINDSYLSERLAKIQLQERLVAMVQRFRFRIARIRHLPKECIAIVLHIGVVVGEDRLEEMGSLWDALYKGDFEDARDAVIDSEYFHRLAKDRDHLRKLLALLRRLSDAGQM